MSEFRVKSGETHTITNANSVMLVKKWVMEDRATINFAPDVSRWEISATESEFHGVSFIDAGRSESPGADGTSPGEAGADGPDGVDLLIQIGISVLDTVVIDHSGANGGNGVAGARGTTGHSAKCSGRDAGNGGTGGNGGAAGNGGDQGEVRIKFWVLLGRNAVVSSSYGKTDTPGPGFNFFGEPGLPGAPGGPGPGGTGGAGKERCGPWPYWSKGSGNPGSAGAPGANGQRGATKTASVAPIPNPGSSDPA